MTLRVCDRTRALCVLCHPLNVVIDRLGRKLKKIHFHLSFLLSFLLCLSRPLYAPGVLSYIYICLKLKLLFCLASTFSKIFHFISRGKLIFLFFRGWGGNFIFSFGQFLAPCQEQYAYRSLHGLRCCYMTQYDTLSVICSNCIRVLYTIFFDG